MLLYIQCIISYFTEKNFKHIEFIQLKRVTLIFTVYNYNGCTMHVNYSCKKNDLLKAKSPHFTIFTEQTRLFRSVGLVVDIITEDDAAWYYICRE